MNARTALSASAVVAVGLLSLTGCSAYDALVHHHETATFDDRGAFDEGAAVDADWLPADAEEITVRTSTQEDAADAVILLSSDSSLDDACVEVERESAPAWVLDDAPDAYKAKTVFACGDWSVIESPTGWLGWAPNSDGERAAASAE